MGNIYVHGAGSSLANRWVQVTNLTCVPCEKYGRSYWISRT